MLEFIAKLFKKKDKENKVKVKTINETIISLKPTQYIKIKLKPDICEQLKSISQSRFDFESLNKNQFNGIVKAVYLNDNSNLFYIEIVSVVVKDNVGTRKEYLVMEHEIDTIYLLQDYVE